MFAIFARGYKVAAKEDIKKLGPWANADLTKTARDNAGVGATSDLPDDIRFIEGVVKLIRKRLARAQATSDINSPAVFFLQPTPALPQSHSSPKRIPMLDNGLEPLTGRLWFVGAAVVSGHFVGINEHDDNALFQLVTDSLELGNVPAILFDPRLGEPEVRFYEKGLGQPETYRKLPLDVSNVSLELILEAVHTIYLNCLVTPDAQTSVSSLWSDSDKWHPKKDAEALIQWSLKAGLVGTFPSCLVRHEQPSPSGRVDLEIEEASPLDQSTVVRHAVLELKVLRSYGSTGKPVPASDTLERIESGVKQAAAYRNDKGARAAALCCFDMRKEDSGEACFEHVKDLADKLRVYLRRWLLFASSSLYRAALAEDQPSLRRTNRTSSSS